MGIKRYQSLVKECCRFASIECHKEFLLREDNWNFDVLKRYMRIWWSGGDDDLLDEVVRCMIGHKQEVIDIASKGATTMAALKEKFDDVFEDIKRKMNTLTAAGFELDITSDTVVFCKPFFDYDKKAKNMLIYEMRHVKKEPTRKVGTMTTKKKSSRATASAKQSKPLSNEDMIPVLHSAVAHIMRRVSVQEDRIAEIEDVVMHADTDAVTAYTELPTVPVKPVVYRSAVVQLTKDIASGRCRRLLGDCRTKEKYSVMYPSVIRALWHELDAIMYMRCGIDVSKRMNSDNSRLDAINKAGKMAELYTIVLDTYNKEVANGCKAT